MLQEILSARLGDPPPQDDDDDTRKLQEARVDNLPIPTKCSCILTVCECL